jgi:hypothetical protein
MPASGKQQSSAVNEIRPVSIETSMLPIVQFEAFPVSLVDRQIDVLLRFELSR